MKIRMNLTLFDEGEAAAESAAPEAESAAPAPSPAPAAPAEMAGAETEQPDAAAQAAALHRLLTAVRLAERRALAGTLRDAARENTYRSWMRQAEALAQEQKDFDLQRVLRTEPRFAALLRRGLSVREADRVLHFDALLRQAQETAAAEAVRQLRERPSRPVESAAGRRSIAGQEKPDFRRMSRREFAAYEERAARERLIP